mgnify:CR=1 FL=1
MEGMALLFYVSLTPFDACPVMMINGVPTQMPPTSLPVSTIIVADPSIVVNGMILANRIISYPVMGPDGFQRLQVAETTTPISVGDGDN